MQSSVWTVLGSGQQTPGVVTLERALNLEPDSALTLCDLGLAYLQMKNMKKAKILFERALDIDPANVRAKECLDAATRLMKVSTQEVK
jgi:tetratricopeptide (TPR) repeat protein